MDTHIGKPFDLDEVVKVLRRLTGREEEPAAQQPSEPPAAPGAAAALPPPDEAESALVDAASALARLDGNRALYLKLLAPAAQQLAALSDECTRLLEQGRRHEAAGLLHARRSVAGVVGAVALAGAMQALETALRGETPRGEEIALMARLREVAGLSVLALEEVLRKEAG
jgi:HPt (histidine-containing phosphotransfer) domain-containing protein